MIITSNSHERKEINVKEENEIVRFVEPILLFSLKRVSNRADAEDLASEIILHVLDGIKKYDIVCLDAWVWRIAHNRYARFCEERKSKVEICCEEFTIDLIGDYDVVDEDGISNEYETIFRYLHTLSSEYKNILVDYYIGELSVKELAIKYQLPETTIKWRLNVSRQKIRDRISSYSKGEFIMDKVYKRINWETSSCNGSMNASAYLSNQVARAICEAAYEEPLTIEEISLKTGLPTMYIEDALPNLIYGDAIQKIGKKYSTDFIILRLKDRIQMENHFKPLIGSISDYFEGLFSECEEKINEMSFYGHDFGIRRLGYIALPLSLREKVRYIKNNILNLENGPFPPRKDGGYGWFIVEESKDESDIGGEYTSGCNITEGEVDFIYWYNIGKYFCNDIYQNGGTIWLSENSIPHKCINGVIPNGILTEDDIVRLLQRNLIIKTDSGYKLNFACFTQEQFTEFTKIFRIQDSRLEEMLVELIQIIKKCFVGFVPKRLDSQINQWVSGFVHSINGYVTDELISRGVLENPSDDKPLTNGVFYVEGKYINV